MSNIILFSNKYSMCLLLYTAMQNVCIPNLFNEWFFLWIRNFKLTSLFIFNYFNKSYDNFKLFNHRPKNQLIVLNGNNHFL